MISALIEKKKIITMKNVKLIILYSIVFIFSSCKKNYQCQCVNVIKSGQNDSLTINYSEYQKKTANKACTDFSDSFRDCKLK